MEFDFPLEHTAEYRRKYCLAEKHTSCKQHKIKDICHLCYRKPKHKGNHKCVCEYEWRSRLPRKSRRR